MNKAELKVVAVVALFALAWLFRYDFQVVSAGGQGVAGAGYLLNRWTGTIYFVAPGFTRELKQEQAPPR